MSSGDVLGAVVDLPEIVTYLCYIAARRKVSVFIDGNIPPVCFIVKVGLDMIRHNKGFHVIHIQAAQRFLVIHAGVQFIAV